MKVLAISGSLRAASINTMLLQALARLAPETILVELYDELGRLPLFNPDLEANEPLVVARFREMITTADAVLIASPEYAHGISGVMKNALDWTVSSSAFVGKPVALLNASPRAVHAYAAIKEVLSTMSARVIAEASITVPLLGSQMDLQDIIADRKLSADLVQALRNLQYATQQSQE